MRGNLNDTRIYRVSDCISFRKTSEPFGGLSNMAPGYKIWINNTEILTGEALYQSCRFPENPEIQSEIFKQHSPMCAKEISRKYMYLTRNNWETDRIKIMKWVLRVKLIYNWYTFGDLLKSTGTKAIVEYSNKDTFWGAKLIGDKFEGTNALGRLLMELREQYMKIASKTVITISPPSIKNFKIEGEQIPPITINVSSQEEGINRRLW